MNINRFWEIISDRVTEFLPDYITNNCNVIRREICKNNDHTYKAIVFERGEGKPSPVIYIEEIYDEFINGKMINEILEDISSSLQVAWEQPKIEVPELDFNMIKDRLGFQLIDISHNTTQLAKLPHKVLDNGLAIIYHVELESSSGLSRFVITNDIANSFNYNLEILDKTAIENMERKHAAVLMKLEDIHEKGYSINYFENEKIIDSGIYMLSNKDLYFGASSILYKGVQEKIAKLLDDEYYVLPSSVHELMIVPTKEMLEIEQMAQIIKEGNENVVSANDMLSNSIFMYDKATKSIKNIYVQKEMEKQPIFDYTSSKYKVPFLQEKSISVEKKTDKYTY